MTADPDALVALADRLREAGEPARAAAAYRDALAMLPARTDLRVQLGNMLKDSAQWSEAEDTYMQAISERPADADVRLQLGHLLKLLGRRSAALEAYRCAARLDPGSPHATAELAAMGSSEEQAQLFDRHWCTGGAEAVLQISIQLDELRLRLDRITASLPAAAAAAAVPLACYDRFRRLYQVPPAPQAPSMGCIAVVLMADGPAPSVLARQLAGFARQSWPRWSLLATGASPSARAAVELAGSADPRIAWVETDPNETRAEAERRLASSLDAVWLLLLADGAAPDPQALAWFAFAAENSSALAFVCDEEEGDEEADERRSPSLRQTVDRDTLLEVNVWGDTVLLRTGALPGLPACADRAALLLELSAQGQVGHIPLPLVSLQAGPAGRPAPQHAATVRAHLSRLQPHERPSITEDAEGIDVTWPASDACSIAVIIPTRDNAADLTAFVEGLLRTAEQPDDVRVVVIDDGGRKAETARLLGRLQSTSVTVRRADGPFNWSRLNNEAARTLDAELLVFANDDMRMLTHGWDTRLRGLLARPDVGAVGAKLLYPDGTIQHAGILFGWRGAPTHHDGLHEPGDAAGPSRRWQVTRAVGAVTGAFLATRRGAFLACGGFDEIALPIAYADIDYCLKLRARRLHVLWTPRIRLHHAEGASRGLDHLDPRRAARNAAELAVMRRRWGGAMDFDPGVNPTWHPATLPFRLLAPPSMERVRRYVAACASADPWLCEPAETER